ncbi:MAG: Intermediate filament protein [Caeruleum heppii]|nr:MAG: Intermediate filament protein [Caeruleum heppii]
MALTRRDVIIAASIAVLAWLSALQWAPFLGYLAYAFVTGIIGTLAGSAAVLLLVSKGKALEDGQQNVRTTSVAFVAPDVWEEHLAEWRRTQAEGQERRPLHAQSAAISDALDGLIDLILRDFVTSWYGKISTSRAFVGEVDNAIRVALLNLLERLTSTDLIEVLVSRLVPVITSHLSDAYEAEKAIRGRHLNRTVTESEELDLAIAARFRDGRLHPAASLSYADTKIVQQDYLRRTLEDLVPEVLPPSQTQSRAVTVMIREMLACAVLSSVMEILSEPDTWNQILQNYGQTMVQDRKTVRKLRAALDEHASPVSKSKSNATFPRLGLHDNERQFERFVRAIRSCNNVSDARRFRSEVSSQLKRGSRADAPDAVYLRRLEAGKRMLEQKVVSLTQGEPAGRRSGEMQRNSSQSSKIDPASLVDLLRNSSGLSYFMEFMDRQRLVTLVQFWIVVDGFRDPLDTDLADGGHPLAAASWTESDRMDLAQINEAYLSKPELHASPSAREAVKSFLRAAQNASAAQYQAARRALLDVQSAALEEMQNNHYPKFKESDLFYKYLTADEASLGPAPPSPTPQRRPLPRSITQVPLSTPLAARPSARARTAGRATASSMDVRPATIARQETPSPRRSFDAHLSTTLSEDDEEDNPLSLSTQSFDQDTNSHDGPDHRVVEAMEAALNNIMEDGPDAVRGDEQEPSIMSADDTGSRLFGDDQSSQSFLELSRAEMLGQKDAEKPSIASLGLVNTSSRIGVFSDDDLFPDQERFGQDDVDESGAENEMVDEEGEDVQEAAPGDLGLSEAISVLSADIERLHVQDAVIESLTKKAELTNNTAELRILRKSKASLQREIRRKELQRQQYIVQESDNGLYGRSTVRIKSVMVGNDADGREYATYLIEVQRQAGDQMAAATWVIARRYSEFLALHQRLRARYRSVRNLEFPRRRVVMKLQKDFLYKRRVALEKYLREILFFPEICRSRELRAFLSQQAITSPARDQNRSDERRDFVTRFYESMADGMDDLLGNIPVLDQLSVAGQNLLSAATTTTHQTTHRTHSATSAASRDTGAIPEDSLDATEAEAELNAYEAREMEPFVKPICDIFLEIFELNRSNNWLRGRAVVVVLHQLLGGTIERKVRDHARALAQEDSLLKTLALVRDRIWPDGGPRRQLIPRSPVEIRHTRSEAGLILATLLPDVAGSVVGRANAQAASRRVFATFNNRRLNTHLIFTLLDEVVDIFFGKRFVVSGRAAR